MTVHSIILPFILWVVLGNSQTCDLLASTVFQTCGYSALDNTTIVDINLACSEPCCLSLSEYQSSCNNIEANLLLDHQLYQEATCVGAVCEDPCLDPGTGLINIAKRDCGISDLTLIFNTTNSAKACSPDCCSSLQSASSTCSDFRYFSTVDVSLTSYQALNCPGAFTCVPGNECFDVSSLTIVNPNSGFLNRALYTCGVSPSLTNITALDPSNLQLSSNETCSMECCHALSNAKTPCMSSSHSATFSLIETSIKLYQAQTCAFSCTPNLCFDPYGLVNSELGATNRVLRYCGGPASFTAVDDLFSTQFNSSLACTPTCCEALDEARKICVNGSSSDESLFQVLDITLTGYQLLRCEDGYTCYPNDKCFDPQGLVNSNRGALSRAMQTCGLPASVTSITNGFSNISVNLLRMCNYSCCEAVDNAVYFCNPENASSSELTVFDAFKTTLPAFQALNCANFTCNPPKCFDEVGLLNSEIGAANKVLKYCGAPADVFLLANLTQNGFDSSVVCRPRCCQEIESARSICSGNTAFDNLVTGIQIFQAATCKPAFACTPNDKCFDPLGIINPHFGAITRTLAACGSLVSLNSLSDVISNKIAFNETLICEEQCCAAIEDAKLYCNNSDAEIQALQAIDVGVTATQLFKCFNFTCYPNDKCFDPQGLVNSQRGAINRALAACGVPNSMKTISDFVDNFTLASSLACNISCCEALETAEYYCVNNSETDPAYSAFVSLLPAYQARRCENFTCSPTVCFDPVGLLNSNIGAANRVMRNCGIVSDINDLQNVVAGSFNSSRACAPSCCAEIERARPYCNTTPSFDTFLDALYIYQAQTCRPTFLCRPNDECVDALGLLNPEIGLLNSALYMCGGSTALSDLPSAIEKFGTLNATLACTFDCCIAFRNAQGICGESSVESALSVLQAFQANTCQNFTCKEIQCYEPILGAINSQLAPLNTIMSDCGTGTDFKRLLTMGQFPNASLMCSETCCDSLRDNYEPYCVDSALYADYEQTIILAQQLYCTNFECTANAPPENSFSLCCGLSFGASVGIVFAIVFVGVALIIGLICYCACCRDRKQFF